MTSDLLSEKRSKNAGACLTWVPSSTQFVGAMGSFLQQRPSIAGHPHFWVKPDLRDRQRLVVVQFSHVYARAA